ncbi:MAG: hypothetical protein P4L99_11850 [Chthoniobacter sp.]|nr:hypothetical protein [Chthoniobacter sp.]
MRTFLRVCGRVALGAILLPLGVLLWFLTNGATRAHSFAAQVLSGPLADARSVTITERIPYEIFVGDTLESKELVPKSVSLSPGQIAELSRAIGGNLDYGQPGIPQCYQPPYHRIEIVRPDGSLVHFDVSFECRIFTFDGRRHPLPTRLSSRLAQFFGGLGMPPRSGRAYADLSCQASGQ